MSFLNVLGLLAGRYLGRSFERRRQRKNLEKNEEKFLNTQDQGQEQTNPLDMAILKSPQELATIATGMKPEQYQAAMPQPNGVNNTGSNKSMSPLDAILYSGNPASDLATKGALQYMRDKDEDGSSASVGAVNTQLLQTPDYLSASTNGSYQMPNLSLNNAYYGNNRLPMNNFSDLVNIDSWLKARR